MKSRCLDPQLLSDYSFLHYNYKYDWLRPTLEEIVDAYTKLYGKELRESDIESDGSESSTTEEVEEVMIKREETKRSITVLFLTLNKKTHTVSALDCTVH